MKFIRGLGIFVGVLLMFPFLVLIALLWMAIVLICWMFPPKIKTCGRYGSSMQDKESLAGKTYDGKVA